MHDALKSSLSGSLHVVRDADLNINASKSSSSLPHVSVSCRCCASATPSVVRAVRADIGKVEGDKNLGWLNLPGPVGAALGLVGVPDFQFRVTPTSSTKESKPPASRSRERKQRPALVRRLLALFIWSFAYVSISLASGLYVILRAMLASRMYNVATRLGLSPSSQQGSQHPKEDASSQSVLQERLEMANIAIKQLKNQSRILQEKLKAAGDRISKLEANQADYATFNALQVKYNQVSSEIARLTKENEELRANSSRLASENAELRQCLAMNEDELGNEINRLGMLARLQNQCLDSCIFPKDDETARADNKEEKNETSEDSIVIVTGMESPSCMPKGSIGSPTPTPVPSVWSSTRRPLVISPADAKPVSAMQASSKDLSWRIKKSETVNPIPVFISKRPSLPPKGSKPQLKPLLLATSETSRRNGAKHVGMRRSVGKSYGMENSKKMEIAVYKSGQNAELFNFTNQVRTLNPCAPAFTPGTVGSEAISNKAIAATKSSAAGVLSPAVPFTFTSPSPNSPFIRSPPPRRQSGGTPIPSFSKTPPTPISSTTPSTTTIPNSYTLRSTDITPTPTPDAKAKASINTESGKGTPRSTRASSVKLIRARAALRNSQRVASGSAAIQAGSPAGLKTVIGVIGDKRVKDSGGVHGKARLVGKGMPPRRALGERTNTEQGLEEVAGRWTSL